MVLAAACLAPAASATARVGLGRRFVAVVSQSHRYRFLPFSRLLDDAALVYCSL